MKELTDLLAGAGAKKTSDFLSHFQLDTTMVEELLSAFNNTPKSMLVEAGLLTSWWMLAKRDSKSLKRNMMIRMILASSPMLDGESDNEFYNLFTNERDRIKECSQTFSSEQRGN